MILFILLYCFLFMLQVLNTQPSSDHNFHINLIKSIRKNGHRFLKYNPNIIWSKNFAYPQFYHWLLSFIPSSVIQKYYIFFGGILNFLQLVTFLLFAVTIYPTISLNISLEKFILISGLIFLFTPFNYAIWNAKNAGISARGFGLLLGQIYLYLISWYYIFDNVVFLLAAFLVAFIILLSSQFAMQFVLFSAPLFGIFFLNASFLFIPILICVLFYIVMPDVARNFLKGQINHKTIYSNYLADKYILRQRYSIWRDFIWDFLLKLKSDFQKAILYIYYNPFLSIIYGFPFLTIFALYIFSDRNIRAIITTEMTIFYLFIPVAISFLIFFLTSFRKTRFLGEPERYMEFCVPQISLLGVVIFEHSYVVGYLGLGISIMMVIIQIILQRLKSRYGITKRQNEAVNQITNHLIEIHKARKNGIRVFSNNNLINKSLISDKWKVLSISLTSIHTGQFHFKEIFPLEYPIISLHLVLPLIRKFEIGWFVLDTEKSLDYEHILRNNHVFLVEKWTVDAFKIYKVCLKS